MALIGLAFFIRFENPELTETQLMLKFWWVWVLYIPIFVVWLILSEEERRG
jgi:hypothetical protein